MKVKDNLPYLGNKDTVFFTHNGEEQTCKVKQVYGKTILMEDNQRFDFSEVDETWTFARWSVKRVVTKKATFFVVPETTAKTLIVYNQVEIPVNPSNPPALGEVRKIRIKDRTDWQEELFAEVVLINPGSAVLRYYR